jgi:hypothetical protein
MPTRALKPLLRRIRAEAARFADDSSGVALIELAYTTPFLMLLSMGGIELANYSITHMRVSQIAVSLADNSSRAKQEVVSGVPRMREVDVNEAFTAAQLQSTELDIENNGTLILSSLEVNADGGQWIHWQRCFGGGGHSSSYGEEGDGDTGTSLTGMGPAGRQVAAEEGFAIMFAEVVYDYTPLMFGRFISEEPIRKTAAMFVRDDRDLAELYNPSPAATQNLCP